MHYDTTRLLELAAKFAGKRILIVGDLMLDRYVIGGVERISPEAPVPVLLVKEERDHLGGAANVANLLAAFGVRTSLVGVVGLDRDGDALLGRLARIGIDGTGIVRHPSRMTTVKTRIVAHTQQLVRVDREDSSPYEEQTIRELCDRVEAAIPGVDGVVISDYGKGVVLPSLIDRTVAACRAAGKPVAVDPKVEHFRQYKGVTLITPNNKEASEGIGIQIRDRESLLAAGAAIRAELDPAILLVTRSQHGMALFERGKELVEIPTVAREVFDVTGAGDMVIAVYCVALACGATAAEAAVLANCAAGVEVTKFGCQPITPAELAAAVEQAGAAEGGDTGFAGA